MKTRSHALVAFAAAALLAGAPAQAGPLTLTAAGLADGFTLTKFASGGTTFGFDYNFLASAALSDGNLAVIDYANGNGGAQRIVKYADLDNRTPADALASVAFAGAINIARVGGKTYAVSQTQGLFEVSSALGLTHVNTPGVSFSLGLWANQATGHLLAASSNLGVVDVDPLTGAHTVITPFGADGVSVSPDGKVVYAEIGGAILGYNILTHALVFNSGAIAGGPDGTGVIAGGALDGDIIVNVNNGTVILIDPTNNSQTVIASGGTRGDFTTPDSNNGTLFLSNIDATYRLAIAGGTIGGSAVPEPGSLALLGLGLIGFGIGRRRRA